MNDDDLYDEDREVALIIFQAECQLLLNQERIRKNGVTNFQSIKVWETFSKQHQSSPSRANNNISYRCRRRNVPSIRLFEEKGNDVEDVLQLLPKELNFTKSSFSKLQHLLPIVTLLCKVFEMFFIVIICLIVFYAFVVLHTPTQAWVSRNTQDIIYPMMRGIRLMALPTIRILPSVNDVYDESCLISNPEYLKMNTYGCWPCETVTQVIDLTGFSNFSSVYYHGGIPFLVKDAYIKNVNINHIENIYLENIDLLSSVNLFSNVHGVRVFNDIFPTGETNLFDDHENLHISSRISRVTQMRVLRQYFPKPYFIPKKTEVSIQHFLILDNFKSPPYSLPLTEFANVFLIQASGSRNIVLIPTEKCRLTCRVISVTLQDGDVFFYNWLYWRPKSVPVQSSSLYLSDNLSVSYVGSFY